MYEIKTPIPERCERSIRNYLDFLKKKCFFVLMWSALEHTDTNRWLGRPRLTTYIYFPIDLSALSLQNLACSVLINFPLICLGFCAQQNSKLFCCGFRKTTTNLTDHTKRRRNDILLGKPTASFLFCSILKGQLITKCPYCVLKSTKKPTKFL